MGPNVTLVHGDCLDVLRELPANSVDAIVTDPPYGLGFMGKAWDDLPPGEEWAKLCLAVLKPGGHLLAFGGTRTSHRLACAIEDAGFEIRDSIAWLYGSGFPKSLDVSKAIDKAAGAEREVVGVIPDIKYSDVKDVVPPVFYLPWRQDTRASYMNFYVRSDQPEVVLRALTGVLKRIDASLPVEDLKTMPQQVRENVFVDRMISVLSAAFAVLATLLASIGLYGVLAYSVAQRTREIGVRMALGADGTRVRVMILRQVSLMMLVGGVIGLVGAIGLGRAGRSILYQLQGYDPVVLGISVVLLTLVALGAGYVPARRASQVDPVQALRYE